MSNEWRSQGSAYLGGLRAAAIGKKESRDKGKREGRYYASLRDNTDLFSNGKANFGVKSPYKQTCRHWRMTQNRFMSFSILYSLENDHGSKKHVTIFNQLNSVNPSKYRYSNPIISFPRVFPANPTPKVDDTTSMKYNNNPTPCLNTKCHNINITNPTQPTKPICPCCYGSMNLGFSAAYSWNLIAQRTQSSAHQNLILSYNFSINDDRSS
jgi:hypothetical protein